MCLLSFEFCDLASDRCCATFWPADARMPGTVPVYGSNGRVGWQNPKFRARDRLRTFDRVVSDGVLSQDDVMALLRFYGNTDSFNRGLELVQKARDAKDTNTLRDEVQRLVVKAEKALSCGPDNTSFYNRVAEILEHRKDLKYKRLPPETFPRDDWPVQIGLRQWWMSRLTASPAAPSQP